MEDTLQLESERLKVVFSPVYPGFMRVFMVGWAGLEPRPSCALNRKERRCKEDQLGKAPLPPRPLVARRRLPVYARASSACRIE